VKLSLFFLNAVKRLDPGTRAVIGHRSCQVLWTALVRDDVNRVTWAITINFRNLLVFYRRVYVLHQKKKKSILTRKSFL